MFNTEDIYRLGIYTMESVEKSAETIEAAIEAGLRELGVASTDVMIEVLEEPSRGVFGIGAKPARVRIIFMGQRPMPTPPPAPKKEPVRQERTERSERPEHSGGERRETRSDSRGGDRNRERDNRDRGARRGDRDRDNRDRGGRNRERSRDRQFDDFDVAFEDPEDLEFAPQSPIIPDEEADEMAVAGKKILQELLNKMQFETSVTIHKSDPNREGEEVLWILNVTGKNATTLIGRRGDMLSSLQYIVRLMLSRVLQRRTNIIVDVNEFKLRRNDRLRQLANRMADQALSTGRTVSLEPMPPNERRIIHMALKERTDVNTKSIGEGNARKVTISPKAQS
jgi:spoIIIJ-associated protein